jgi:glycosyltransferase involved in cell wall biosynthesis
VAKKKIVWIAHEGNKSGANNALLSYASLLKVSDYEMVIVVPSIGNMFTECQKRGLNVKRFYYYWVIYSDKIGIYNWLKRRLRNGVTFFSITMYLYKEKPDLVITNSIVNSCIFSFAAKALRVPHIWFIQEFGNKDHGLSFDWGYALHLNFISFFSSKIVTVSNAVRVHIKDYIKTENIEIIFNRITIPQKYIGSHMPHREGKELNILYLSQIAEGKNQLEAIEAIHILREWHIPVKLEIAGAILNNTYYNKLKDYINSNDLENVILFTGFTEDGFEKIKNADVVILCSRSEACALTIFETLQIGTPIVVSNTGGNPEIVQDNFTGLHYSFGRPESLANKIKSLYENLDLRLKLSENAKTCFLEKYSPEISLEQLEKIL